MPSGAHGVPGAGILHSFEGGAYDVASNTWTVREALPEPLDPNGATTSRQIYVAGRAK